MWCGDCAARWGRAQEVYSEDPRLTSALTIGYVTGIQGDQYNGTANDPNYALAAACCKHFV
jgi:beta-glucosidase